MYTNKFKNHGSFATSAMVSAMVVGIHFAGLQLLIVDQQSVASEVAAQELVVNTPNAEKKMVARVESIVVTASRL